MIVLHKGSRDSGGRVLLLVIGFEEEPAVVAEDFRFDEDDARQRSVDEIQNARDNTAGDCGNAPLF